MSTPFDRTPTSRHLQAPRTFWHFRDQTPHRVQIATGTTSRLRESPEAGTAIVENVNHASTRQEAAFRVQQQELSSKPRIHFVLARFRHPARRDRPYRRIRLAMIFR